MKRPQIPRGDDSGLPRHGFDRWFARRARNFRLVNRLDPVWGAVVLAVVVVIIFIIGVGGMLYPEPAKITRVEDRRILQSFTDPSGCFVEAAPTPEGRLLVSLSRASACQSEIASGGVTLYDPVWRGFARQTLPFEGDEGYSDSATIGNVADAVWIRGNMGGLSRWIGDRWVVWASQTAMKIGGRMVSDRDIAVAAPYPGGSRSMFSSLRGAVSVYDTNTSRWTDYGNLPGTGEVEKLAWSRKGVWVARNTGLWFAPFSLAEGIGTPRRISTDPVISLSLTDADEAMVLHAKTCVSPNMRRTEAQGACRSLLRYKADGSSFYSMLDTSGAPVDLSRRDVQFVATTGSELLLAGTKGVWRYDTASRSWTQPETRFVTVMETGLDGTVAYGGRGWVAMQRAGARAPAVARLPDQSRIVVMVTFDNNNRPLFTDDRGTLMRLAPDGSLTTLFEITAPEARESTFVASSPGNDYFISANGQVSLQRNLRRYTSGRSNMRLAGMANARLYAQLGSLALGFVPSGAQGQGSLVAFDLSSPAVSASIPVDSVEGMTLASATQSFFTNNNGRLFGGRISLGRAPGIAVEDLMPNQPEEGPDAEDVRDVALLGDDLVLSGDWGIRAYDPATRSWESVATMGTRTIAAKGGGRQLLAAGNDGILRSFRYQSNRWLPAINVPNVQFAFEKEEDIVDTLLSPRGQIVFLARKANGGVLQVYDPASRRIVYTSNIGSGYFADGKILTFGSNQNWLVRLGTRAFTPEGILPLAPSSRGVISGWAESENVFVTVEQDSLTGLKFLHRRLTNTNRSLCLYRGNTIEASARTDAFMPADDRLVTATEQGVWINNLSTRRWSKVDLPSAAYQVGMVGNSLFARATAPESNGELYRINTRVLPAYDSCDPKTREIDAETFRNAVVRPDNGAVYSILPARGAAAPRVIKVEPGNRVVTSLAPAGAPPQSGQPLRSFVDEETGALWLAYPAALARYQFSTRTWTQFSLPRTGDWSQVLLEAGKGALEGKLVASYISESNWLQLRVRYGANAGDRPEILDNRIANPGPVPGGRVSGRLREIRQTGSTLYFRFDDRIVTMNRRDRSWNPPWPILDPKAEMAIINGRFVVYAPSLGQVFFQRGRGDVGLGAPLRQVVVPAGRPLMFDSNGLVGWTTIDGAVVRCNASATCSTTVEPVPELDLTGVTSIRQLGEDFLLTGDDGLGIVVTRDPNQRFRRIASKSTPVPVRAPLSEIRNEPVGVLRRSRDGESLFRLSPSGGFRVVDGGIPEIMQAVWAALPSGRLGVFNPDDGLYIGGNRLIGLQGEIGPLPQEIADQEITAVGVFGNDYWFQTPASIQVFSPECFAPEEPKDGAAVEIGNGLDAADTESGTEGASPPPPCATRSFPAPQGQTIAYIEAAETGEEFMATMQDGSAMRYNGVWDLEREAFSLPEVSQEAFLRATTFIRPDGKRSFYQPITVTPAADGSSFSIDVPVEGRTARRMTYSGFQAGRMAPLDLGWLRFDSGRNMLVAGRTGGETEIRLADAIDAGQRFFPFTWSAPAPQPDGSLIVALRNGQLHLKSAANPSSMQAAEFVYRSGMGAAENVPDTGGHWQGRRFLPAVENTEARVPEMLYRRGAFAVSQDRRETGVQIRNGVNRVLDRAGFLWDRFTDLGLTPENRVILRSDAGPMMMNDPTAGAYTGPVVWSADTLDAIEAATDRRRPGTGVNWIQDRRKNIAHLGRDTLVSAVFADNTLYMSTNAGIGRQRGFGIAAETDTQVAPVSLQISRGTAPPRVFAVVDGAIMLVNAEGALEPAPPPIAGALSTLEAWRVGPLVATATGPGRGQFELRYEDRDGDQSPALGVDRRFRADSTLQARFAPDGALYLVTKAGLMRAGSGNTGLAGITLLKAARPNTAFDLRTREGRLFAMTLEQQKPVDCAVITGEGQSGCAAEISPDAALETFLPAQQSLRAEKGVRGWQFSTSYPVSPQAAERSVSLENGRFSFDRMRAVGFCDGAFYMINYDGAVLRAPSAARWTDARVVEMQPSGSALYCKADRPVDVLPDGLWLLRPDGAWLNLPDARGQFAAVSSREGRLASQVFSIRSSGGLNLLRRSNDDGLLLHSADQALQVVQTFGDDGPSRARTVRQRGPALEIDTPTGFFAAGAWIWALTPDGIVNYGRNDASSAFFKAENASRVRLPEGCDVTNTRRISTGETALYCENGKMLRAIAGSSGLILSTPVSGRPLWQATSGLVSLTSSKQGLQSLTLDERRISPAITRGGFPFDLVSSAIVAGNGGYNLITDIGWWGYSARGISLAEAGGNREALRRSFILRRDRPELAQAQNINLTPDPDRLCVSTGVDSQVNITSGESGFGASIRYRQPCREYFGRDRLRSFAKSSEGRFYSVLRVGQNRGYEDRLVNGRFNSDRVTGLPNAQYQRGQGRDKTYLCAPTALPGVSIWGDPRSQRGRVETSACGALLSPVPVRADGSYFTIVNGDLYRSE